MNTKKNIEECLNSAPKPAAPDGLLEKLQTDVSINENQARQSLMRRCFAPAGHLSLRRIAAGIAIAAFALLPLSYGTVKAIQYFTIFEFEYPKYNSIYTQTRTISSDNIQNEEQARQKEKEFYQLYKKGKAEEIKPGIWSAILSDGERFNYGGDPELLGLSEKEQKEVLKKQFDEIHELKKAGKFEKTYMPEHDFEINGVTYRYFQARYVLSDGTVKLVGSSEPATEENQHND
jgi:hypothetical protein